MSCSMSAYDDIKELRDCTMFEIDASSFMMVEQFIVKRGAPIMYKQEDPLS